MNKLMRFQNKLNYNSTVIQLNKMHLTDVLQRILWPKCLEEAKPVETMQIPIVSDPTFLSPINIYCAGSISPCN